MSVLNKVPKILHDSTKAIMLELYFLMEERNKKQKIIHRELSNMTDSVINIYDVTKEIAGVAKHIKKATKESIDPPNPVIEAIDSLYQSKYASKQQT